MNIKPAAIHIDIEFSANFITQSDMSTASLSASELRRVVSLLERKSSLEAELARVESEILTIANGTEGGGSRKRPATAPKPARKTKARTPRKSSKKHTLRDGILAILEKAGPAGATVKEIARQLKITTRHVFVWYATRGKNIDEIYKMKPGVYGLKSDK